MQQPERRVPMDIASRQLVGAIRPERIDQEDRRRRGAYGAIRRPPRHAA